MDAPQAAMHDPGLKPSARMTRRQEQPVELPVARAVDPSGAPHAADRGAERIWGDDKDYFGAGALKRVAAFGLQHDSRRGQRHQIRE